MIKFYSYTVFLVAGGGMAIEIAASRLLAPWWGVSTYTWAMVIAVVLSGLAAGNWAGGRLANPEATPEECSAAVGLSLALGAVSSIVILLILMNGDPLDAFATAWSLIFPGIMCLAFFVPSFCAGIVAPVLTRLAVDASNGETGRVLGRMFAMGSVGAIAGTLVSAFLFIQFLGSFGTVAAVAALYAVLSVIFFRQWRRVPKWVSLMAVFLITGVAVLVGNTSGSCDRESVYGCMRVLPGDAVAGINDRQNRSRALFIDNAIHSVSTADPGNLYFTYAHLIDEYVRKRFGPNRPLSAFFLGGGGYSLPRAWAHDNKNSRLAVAEIDPVVTRTALDHMFLSDIPPGAGLITHAGDGRRVLKDRFPGRRFDVVVGDAFREIAVPPHLVTREFQQLVASRLKPGGVYFQNVIDTEGSLRLVRALVRTMMQDFPVVEVWPSQVFQKKRQLKNYIIVGSQRGLAEGILTSTRGISRSWNRWTEKQLEDCFTEERFILTDNFAPIERLQFR